MHQDLANATFQVIAGDSRGSGFSFMREDLVVTNCHVITSCLDSQRLRQNRAVILRTEESQILNAQILHFDYENDFSILQLNSPLPSGRKVLHPPEAFMPTRGKRIIFAGYPHGMPQLLTNEAIISAPLEHGQFAIDGMVNGGNSGGPIIDAESGFVVGLITARRYVSGEKADALMAEAIELRTLLEQTSKNISVEIMGVNFAGLLDMFGHSLQVIMELMESNANPGIGIGYPISPIVEMAKQQKRIFMTKF